MGIKLQSCTLNTRISLDNIIRKTTYLINNENNNFLGLKIAHKQ